MIKHILIPCIILLTLVVGCKSSVTDVSTGGGPTTTIVFDLPQDAYVSLWIENEYNTVVASLLSHEQMEAGEQQVDFQAAKLPSGIYFYILYAEAIPPETGSFTQTKRMLLIR